MGRAMKKTITLVLLAMGAFGAMAGTAAALSTGEAAVNGTIIGGGGGRVIGCAGNDVWVQAVCVDDPFPTSSPAIGIQN